MVDMKVEFDRLVADYPAFEWTRQTGTHEFKGALRADGGVHVVVQRSEQGWEARARVNGERVEVFASGVCESPCEAMADLLVRGLCVALKGGEGEVMLRAERDGLNTRVNELVAANMTLEGMRATATRAAKQRDEAQAQLAVRTRELDNAHKCANIRMAELGEELDAMTNERDDLRVQLKAALACGKGADADAVSRVEAADKRTVLVAAEASRLRTTLAQETARAERWQECAADLLGQVAHLRAKVWRREQAEPSLAQDLAESMSEVRHG